MPSGIPNATLTLIVSFICERFIVSDPISLIEFKVDSGPVIPISFIFELIDFNLSPCGSSPVVFILIGTVFPSFIFIVASTHF